MYIFRSKDFTEELKKEILSLYIQGYSIESIAKMEFMFYKDAVACLHQKGVSLDTIKGFNSEMELDSNSIIFTADYHLGSTRDHLDYAKYLYEYAEANNIHDIYILGNFFHGNNNYVAYDMKNPENQVAYAIDSFPSAKGVKTHILFGNRDYEVLSSYSDGIDELTKRKDFDILGFQSTYVLWKDQYITLFHNIKKYDFNIPKLGKPFISVRGDNYGFHISKSNTIYLPPMSDFVLAKSKTPLPGLPINGFVEVKAVDDAAYIAYCEIDEKHITKQYPIIEKKLTKKEE